MSISRNILKFSFKFNEEEVSSRWIPDNSGALSTWELELMSLIAVDKTRIEYNTFFNPLYALYVRKKKEEKKRPTLIKDLT